MTEDNEHLSSFRFVVATRRKPEERESLPVVNFLSLLNVDGKYEVELDVAFDNDRGLPSVYNERIDEELAKGAKRHDFIVFMHDDIWPSDVFMFDKIVSANAYFDVIGACGGKGWESYGDGRSPMIWTHASRGKGLSGFMAHAADEAQSGVKHEITYDGRSIFSTSYGRSPSRTLTLDGCFICFSKSALDKGLRFDERFKFHFYDMDVCFSAYVKGIRVGTAPVLLVHESLGMSVSQPQFMEAQSEFLKKWFGKS